MLIELDKELKQSIELLREIGKEYLRPLGIEADRSSKAIPVDHPFYNLVAQTGFMARGIGSTFESEHSENPTNSNKKSGNSVKNVLVAEEGSYWDRGTLVSLPGPGLGGPPVIQMGTSEQRDRFMSIFKQRDKPVWAAFAMTEPEAGSDVAKITTRAVKSEKGWILNGEKMFSSNSSRAEWVVVFATIDPNLGRQGHRAFVVEKGTPGFDISRVEQKMGIKAYETASFKLTDCVVDFNNLLGGESYYSSTSKSGFEGAMSTFNATRPIVAAMGVGIARAAYDIAKEFVLNEVPENSSLRLERYRERLQVMQAKLTHAKLLCLRAAWLLDSDKPNGFEASMAKLYAPPASLSVVTEASNIVGLENKEKSLYLQKLARDVKAIDIVEGTQQIQRRVVARNIIIN